ncbi:MAG: hypothetical protein FWG65_13250 [Turicibacter sp.]|nr:hypothetical protein [Turicibacter sp.]
MSVKRGYLYILDNDFYIKANDPKLPKAFKGDVRPVYVIKKDDTTGLYWVAPCTKQWNKYQNMILDRQSKNKSVSGIQPLKTFGIKSVFLLQDMFPVSEDYITTPYTIRKQHVNVTNPNKVSEFEKIGNDLEKDFRKYKKPVTYRPDAIRIEKFMLAEQADITLHATYTTESAKHPNHALFLQQGNDYIIIGNQATAAAKLLNLPTTPIITGIKTTDTQETLRIPQADLADVIAVITSANQSVAVSRTDGTTDLYPNISKLKGEIKMNENEQNINNVEVTDYDDSQMPPTFDDPAFYDNLASSQPNDDEQSESVADNAQPANTTPRITPLQSVIPNNVYTYNAGKLETEFGITKPLRDQLIKEGLLSQSKDKVGIRGKHWVGKEVTDLVKTARFKELKAAFDDQQQEKNSQSQQQANTEPTTQSTANLNPQQILAGAMLDAARENKQDLDTIKGNIIPLMQEEIAAHTTIIATMQEQMAFMQEQIAEKQAIQAKGGLRKEENELATDLINSNKEALEDRQAYVGRKRGFIEKLKTIAHNAKVLGADKLNTFFDTKGAYQSEIAADKAAIEKSQAKIDKYTNIAKFYHKIGEDVQNFGRALVGKDAVYKENELGWIAKGLIGGHEENIKICEKEIAHCEEKIAKIDAIAYEAETIRDDRQQAKQSEQSLNNHAEPSDLLPNNPNNPDKSAEQSDFFNSQIPSNEPVQTTAEQPQPFPSVQEQITTFEDLKQQIQVLRTEMQTTKEDFSTQLAEKDKIIATKDTQIESLNEEKFGLQNTIANLKAELAELKPPEITHEKSDYSQLTNLEDFGIGGLETKISFSKIEIPSLVAQLNNEPILIKGTITSTFENLPKPEVVPFVLYSNPKRFNEDFQLALADDTKKPVETFFSSDLYNEKTTPAIADFVRQTVKLALERTERDKTAQQEKPAQQTEPPKTHTIAQQQAAARKENPKKPNSHSK